MSETDEQPTKQTRKRYDKKIKAEAVALVRQSHRSHREVAEQINVHPTLISKWVTADNARRKGRGSEPGKKRGPYKKHKERVMESAEKMAALLHPTAVESFHRVLPALQAQKVNDLGLQPEDVEPIRQVLNLARHAGMSTGQLVQRMFESVMMEALKR